MFNMDCRYDLCKKQKQNVRPELSKCIKMHREQGVVEEKRERGGGGWGGGDVHARTRQRGVAGAG